MGRKLVVSVGDIYGRLTIVEELQSRIRASGGTKRIFRCVCDCGIETEVSLSNLRSGKTRSCGRHSVPHSPSSLEKMRLANTDRDDYHGMEGSLEWNVWKGIKRRCYQVRARGYANYGGRGIVMCSGWKSSFKSFFEDMGSRESLDYSIDRIDGDGNYSCGHCEECVSKGWPANCRWATRAEQRRNQKDVRFLEFRGDRLCLKDMATKYGMTKGQLHSRLAAGWSLSGALLTPVREWKGDRKFHQVPESERDAEWRRDAERRSARIAGN